MVPLKSLGEIRTAVEDQRVACLADLAQRDGICGGGEGAANEAGSWTGVGQESSSDVESSWKVTNYYESLSQEV